MTTATLFKSLLIAAVVIAAFAATAHAADSTIVIAHQDGTQTATFRLNGSACTLKNDVVRCQPSN